MKERDVTVMIVVKSSVPLKRIREKVLCNLAKRTDSPPVYIVQSVKVWPTVY